MIATYKVNNRFDLEKF